MVWQSEVVLHSNLQNHGEKDKECSWEWLVNTDPVLKSYGSGQPAQAA